MNFEIDDTKQSSVALCSNSTNSASMGSVDFRNLKDDFLGKPGEGCGSEDITLSMESNHAMNAKRGTFSVDDSNSKACLGNVSNAAGPSEVVDAPVSQSRSPSGEERIILHEKFMQTCESDWTCDKTGSCFFGAQTKCENVHTEIDGCVTVSPGQGSNYVSLTCDKERKDHDDKLPMKDAINLCIHHAKEVDEAVDIQPIAVEVGLVDVDISCSSDLLKSEIDDTSFTANIVVSRNARKDRNPFKLGSNVAECLLVKNHEESRSGKSKNCNLRDDDLLISAILKKRTFKSIYKESICKSKHLSKQKRRRGSCKLPIPKWSISERRTVLSWLIQGGILSVNEMIQYCNIKTDIVVKEGMVTCNGILCKCCDMVISISEFKRHAGFRLNRPCLNLIMESGKPFALCQLEAWSGEYKARKDTCQIVQVEQMDENDDICGHCAHLGDLICCDNCPSTFHKECLYTQEVPGGNWYCQQCTCKICGDGVNNKEASTPPGTLKCSQCGNQYHEACLKENSMHVDSASGTWFCCETCQEVYLGLQERIGVMNVLSDGCRWTLLKNIDGDQKVHSAQDFLALKAECNSKLAVALTILEECFQPMVDPSTGVDMITQVVYNWGSKFPRLNYSGFYTVVLEKDDTLIAVASIRIHGVTVAEMPLVATCSRYRRQGMCHRLLNAIESMLKSLKVEKLVISAIPSLEKTWKAGFGFTPLEDYEKRSLSNINFMVFPEALYLKKPLGEN